MLVLQLILLVAPLSTFAQYQAPGGRVAPGVPPQQYQPGVGHHQQAPPPHHIQQQQQHHQVPIQHVPGVPPQQYQQVPGQVPGQVPQHHIPQHVGQQHVPQQQQQHVPQLQQIPQQQHVPQAGGHGHEHHEQGRLLDASNVLNERSHIQEHLDVPIDTSQMTEQELQFHYFKMHDADNNNKLDGCELVKSLIHWHDSANHNPNSGHAIPEQKIFKDEELVQMIDPILQNDDLNKDGTIDYAEFSRAQANAAARAGGAATQ